MKKISSSLIILLLSSITLFLGGCKKEDITANNQQLRLVILSASNFKINGGTADSILLQGCFISDAKFKVKDYGLQIIPKFGGTPVFINTQEERTSPGIFEFNRTFSSSDTAYTLKLFAITDSGDSLQSSTITVFDIISRYTVKPIAFKRYGMDIGENQVVTATMTGAGAIPIEVYNNTDTQFIIDSVKTQGKDGGNFSGTGQQITFPKTLSFYAINFSPSGGTLYDATILIYHKRPDLIPSPYVWYLSVNLVSGNQPLVFNSGLPLTFTSSTANYSISIPIDNSNNYDVDITSMSSSNANLDAGAVSAFTVYANSGNTVNISFNNLTPGLNSADLNIFTNDANYPSYLSIPIVVSYAAASPLVVSDLTEAGPSIPDGGVLSFMSYSTKIIRFSNPSATAVDLDFPVMPAGFSFLPASYPVSIPAFSDLDITINTSSHSGGNDILQYSVDGGPAQTINTVTPFP